jgi:hypothetical protein
LELVLLAFEFDTVLAVGDALAVQLLIGEWRVQQPRG